MWQLQSRNLKIETKCFSRHWYQPFRYGFVWYQPTRLNCKRREYLKFCVICIDVHTWPESINLYLVKTVKLSFTVTHIRCNRLTMQCLIHINALVIGEDCPTWFGPLQTIFREVITKKYMSEMYICEGKIQFGQLKRAKVSKYMLITCTSHFLISVRLFANICHYRHLHSKAVFFLELHNP